VTTLPARPTPLTIPDSEIVLRDGSTAHVRSIGPQDVDLLSDLLGRLSPEALWLRFMGFGVDVRRMAERLTADGVGLLALTGGTDRAIAHACYMPDGPSSAEVAFAVDDAWQGRGIATVLLAHLAQLATERGVTTFNATVHSSNHHMLKVFRDSGFPLEVHVEPGTLQVEFPAQLGPDARARFEERDDLAAAAAVGHVLVPASVAVIGASRRPGSIGGAVVRNLTAAAFRGELYPINPHGRSVAGRRAFGSVLDIPGPIELAVIAVGAAQVPGAARECATKGVRALVVLSAGFGEIGPEGRALQDELLGICREAGMRLVGPNCLGVINTDPAVALNATFAPGRPPAGRIAFASQSGAYGIAALGLAARRGVGLSSFVSMGDKADLSGNDFLRFWERDRATDLVLLYLESLGNPRRFGHIARRLTATKPVIAVKGGRTAAGRRAAASHTGALLEASEATVDALFDHAGVIRVDTLDEQLDVAALLAAQPLPRGDRVAIVTNAGGPGIACADACAAAGLRVEPLSHATSEALRGLLPAAASVGNPVDMLAAANEANFRRALEAVAVDPDVDAVIAIFIPPLPGRRADPVLRPSGPPPVGRHAQGRRCWPWSWRPATLPPTRVCRCTRRPSMPPGHLAMWCATRAAAAALLPRSHSRRGSTPTRHTPSSRTRSPRAKAG
jgi:succinyl-CoA synthetase alpha subunit/GNAT superfamily N-acetyltransferase